MQKEAEKNSSRSSPILAKPTREQNDPRKEKKKENWDLTVGGGGGGGAGGGQEQSARTQGNQPPGVCFSNPRTKEARCLLGLPLTRFVYVLFFMVFASVCLFSPRLRETFFYFIFFFFFCTCCEKSPVSSKVSGKIDAFMDTEV